MPWSSVRLHLPDHPTQLLLIRHGEVESRYHRIFGGSRIDMELSPLGHRQAAALAGWIADWPLDRMVASPMRRVRQTLAPMAAQRRMEPQFDADLREVDFGVWTGFAWDQIKDRFGASAFDWLEIIEQGGIAEGESAAALMQRVGPALQRVIEGAAHQRVALFCHGGIIRVMLALMLRQPLSEMAHFNIEYGSLTVVELQPGKKHGVELELLNFCPPLKA
jgi:broad specificity phosphatase PhoE